MHLRSRTRPLRWLSTWLSAKLLIILALFYASMSFAQEQQQEEGKDGGGKKFGKMYGIHTGPLLPNQVPGMSEIMPVWGVRYGFPARNGMLEFGLANASSLGTTYYNGSVSFRGDFNLEDMWALGYAGLDIHYYKPPSDTYSSFFGGHVGGGFAAHLGDLLWFRTDMKFNLSPGTMLYIGFGFEWREKPSGGAEGGGQEGQQ